MMAGPVDEGERAAIDFDVAVIGEGRKQSFDVAAVVFELPPSLRPASGQPAQRGAR
jgi:hypothetical protein